MSKLKDITKELTGRALSPFHRKTGLNQLERNNEMQDGILDGILSQVDDAYITKAEQSNVMHLENSGDGVVVLDSIEGNTLVNLLKDKIDITLSETISNSGRRNLIYTTKNNEPFTLIVNLIYSGDSTQFFVRGYKGDNTYVEFGASNNITSHNGILKILCKSGIDLGCQAILIGVRNNKSGTIIKDAIILEGDWTNKEIPSYFEGMQSSFEEKVNEQGKYEVEVVSNNKNLYNVKDVNVEDWMNSGGVTLKKINNNILLSGTVSSYFDFRVVQSSWNPNLTSLINKLPVGTTLTMSNNLTGEKNTINYWSVRRNGVVLYPSNTLTIQQGDTEIGGFVRFQNDTTLNNTILKVQIEIDNKATTYIPTMQNKIKFQLNEPLRAVGDVKDRLCVRDGRLVVERRCAEEIFDGSGSVGLVSEFTVINRYSLKSVYKYKTASIALSDKFMSNNTNEDFEHVRYDGSEPYSRALQLYINKDKLVSSSITEVKKYLQTNPLKVIGILFEPIYEEVTNEYGQPIILEGYENGTLYIDSTITPTTTVRYTPKMEAFSVCNEIQENNVALSSDINDNIITYMMEVDYMITEKELNSASVCSVTQRMEVLDMTSMQKRTFDMLARLFKGKTLTKEECETRVTVYLSAGKITDEQAEELMLLIAETYQ